MGGRGRERQNQKQRLIFSIESAAIDRSAKTENHTSDHTMTHASSIVSHLRSVALNVPDLSVAESFFTQVWHLDVVSKSSDGTYLRGTGTDHHLISLHAHPGPASVRHVSLRVHHAQALEQAAQAARQAGARALGPVAALSDPAGPCGPVRGGPAS